VAWGHRSIGITVNEVTPPARHRNLQFSSWYHWHAVGTGPRHGSKARANSWGGVPGVCAPTATLQIFDQSKHTPCTRLQAMSLRLHMNAYTFKYNLTY
jgi:hypothetical protein